MGGSYRDLVSVVKDISPPIDQGPSPHCQAESEAIKRSQRPYSAIPYTLCALLINPQSISVYSAIVIDYQLREKLESWLALRASCWTRGRKGLKGGSLSILYKPPPPTSFTGFCEFALTHATGFSLFSCVI